MEQSCCSNTIQLNIICFQLYTLRESQHKKVPVLLLPSCSNPQVFVETLDRCFENVCELDLIFHVDRVHNILQEICIGGMVLETNMSEILTHIDSQTKQEKSEANAVSTIKVRTSLANCWTLSVEEHENQQTLLPRNNYVSSCVCWSGLHSLLSSLLSSPHSARVLCPPLQTRPCQLSRTSSHQQLPNYQEKSNSSTPPHSDFLFPYHIVCF